MGVGVHMCQDMDAKVKGSAEGFTFSFFYHTGSEDKALVLWLVASTFAH